AELDEVRAGPQWRDKRSRRIGRIIELNRGDVERSTRKSAQVRIEKPGLHQARVVEIDGNAESVCNVVLEIRQCDHRDEDGAFARRLPSARIDEVVAIALLVERIVFGAAKEVAVAALELVPVEIASADQNVSVAP